MNEPVRKRVRVACDASHAFTVFTSRIDLWWPQGHRRFARSVMVLEAKAGGMFAERAPDGEEFRMGEVISCDPPREIRYSWYPGGTGRPTLVEIRFTADRDHTLVEVTHSEAESGLGTAWPDRARLFDRNWNIVLPAYERALQGSDRPVGDGKVPV